MITEDQVIKRIESQIAICKSIESDWISLTVETGKRILELLKSKPRIVRCDECRWGNQVGEYVFCHCKTEHKYATHGGCYPPDWGCADGEKRDNNA